MPTPRFENETYQERVTLVYQQAALTADTTAVVYEVPAGRSFRVDRVRYYNATGLAEHASDYFAISAKNGSTVVAGPLSTDSAGAGDNGIVAATWTDVAVVTAAGANVLAAAAVLTVLFDETGTATLPAGVVVIDGYLI